MLTPAMLGVEKQSKGTTATITLKFLCS